MSKDQTDPAGDNQDALPSSSKAESSNEATAESKTNDAVMKRQQQIDVSLRHTFGLTENESQSLTRSIQGMLEADAMPNSRSAARPTEPSFLATVTESRLFQVALVASLLLAIGIGISRTVGSNSVEPYFAHQPLAIIFHDSVSQGFQPYYDCEDMKRFADTFEGRQGQRLVLDPMPAGTEMLGLSYLGGISRDTTAMLAKADNQKVIVFVDTLKHQSILDAVTQKSDQHPDLNVFVVEKYGLVFVEVSALDSAQVLKYIVPE